MADRKIHPSKRRRSDSLQKTLNLTHTKRARFQDSKAASHETVAVAQESSRGQTSGSSFPDSAPLEVSVVKFAESRSRELEALVQTVQNVGGTTLSFQRLPRHMRRRAMSHDIRRIPRRLRTFAKAELEKREKKGSNKRPSRQHRRRPSNLLSEYLRRQKQNVWLETHIWHAKRFKMTTAWGYRLPVHPSDKSLRACFRASTYYSLLQDVSYECCIEVRGPWQGILDALSHVTSKDTGLTFAAKMTSTGQRWGKVMMYSCDSYPQGAVAPLTFLWQTQAVQHVKENGFETNGDPSNGKEVSRVLWLWCHPASYSEVWSQLSLACRLTCSTASAGNSAADPEQLDGKGGDISKPSKQNRKFGSPPAGTEACFGLLCLHSLKDQLTKFRLIGPASSLILQETLKLMDISCLKGDMSAASSADGQDSRRWWQKYYVSEETINQFSTQMSSWEHVTKCQSPDELPPRVVLALTVRDPRVLLPAMHSKAAVVSKDSSAGVVTLDQLSVASAVSPIWSEAVRNEVSKSKISEQQMNKLRSQLFVPGSTLQLGADESRIPVLLLQQPGSQVTSSKDTASVRSGTGSGWDIIVPKGWGMAFWIAMVYRGARVGGLREARSLATRSGVLHFPHDFPDTAAGQQQQIENRDFALDKYVRRPPAKRVNYHRIGVPAPFHCPWTQLMAQWQERAGEILNSSRGSGTLPVDSQVVESGQSVLSPTTESTAVSLKEGNHSEGMKERTLDSCDVADGGDTHMSNPESYVLRCQRLVCSLQEVVSGTKFKQNPQRRKLGSIHNGQNDSKKLSVLLSHSLHTDLVFKHLSSLVPVIISCRLRGVPAERAMICLPTAADLAHLTKDAKFSGPVEQLHSQGKKKAYNSTKRVTKGKIAVGSSSENPAESANKGKQPQTAEKTENASNKDSTKTLNAKQVVEKNAFLKGSCKIVGGATDRLIIGFLTNGDFDLGQGHGFGIGFCSLAALLVGLEDAVWNKPVCVLVRNVNSRQYRFADLSILR